MKYFSILFILSIGIIEPSSHEDPFDKYVKQLTDDLTGQSDQKRDVSQGKLMALGQLVLKDVIKLQDHKDKDVQKRAQEIMKAVDQEAKEILNLIKQLKDPSKKDNACKKLIELSIKSLPQLEDVAKLGDKNVSKQATQTIQKIKDQMKEIEALVTQLAHEAKEKRDEASKKLLELGPTAMIHVIKAFYHEDAEVRSRAKKIIGSLQSKLRFDLPVLVNEDLKIKAEVSVHWICSGSPVGGKGDDFPPYLNYSLIVWVENISDQKLTGFTPQVKTTAIEFKSGKWFETEEKNGRLQGTGKEWNGDLDPKTVKVVLVSGITDKDAGLKLEHLDLDLEITIKYNKSSSITLNKKISVRVPELPVCNISEKADKITLWFAKDVGIVKQTWTVKDVIYTRQLASFTVTKADGSIFPLQVGNKWKYVETKDSEFGKHVVNFQITGKQDKQIYSMSISYEGTDRKLELWYGQTDKGVKLHYKKIRDGKAEKEAFFDPASLFIMLPSKKGDKWTYGQFNAENMGEELVTHYKVSLNCVKIVLTKE